MIDDVTITDPAFFITIWYWVISIAFLILFSSYAWKINYWRGIKKTILFIAVFIGVAIQYLIIRFGIDPVYHHFGFSVFNDNSIRYSAMFFMIAYLIFLPVFYKRDKDNHNN